MRPILRSTLWLASVAAMASPAATWGRQQPADQTQSSTQGTSQAGSQTASSASQPESLADAARKARERKKDSKPEKVFTNENIPTTGGISTVGTVGPATSADGTAQTGDATGGKKSGTGADEKAWRDRFARLHAKLDQDKADVNVMQRELGVLDVQYYNDPVKAMQQGLTREDINKKTADIDAKKQAVIADQQAIDDAEDELRKAGGDPGWAR